MTRNSISIYCYNHDAEDCYEFTTLSDFLYYLNERDDLDFESENTYSTSKKRLTDTFGIEWEESK